MKKTSLVLPAMMFLASLASQAEPKPAYVQVLPSYKDGCASLAVDWIIRNPESEQIDSSSIWIVQSKANPSGSKFPVKRQNGTYTAYLAYKGQCPKDYISVASAPWPLEFYVTVVPDVGEPQFSSRVRVGETAVSSLVPVVPHQPQSPQVSEFTQYGYAPYLFVSFKTSPPALTRVEATCDQTSKHTSDVTGGVEHLHVLRDVRANETCGINVVFIDMEGKDVGPPKSLGSSPIKAPENPVLDATVEDNKFNSTKFHISQNNLSALKDSVVSGAKTLIAENNVSVSPDLTLDTTSLAKGQTYTLRLLGYRVPPAVQDLAQKSNIDTRNVYTVEKVVDFAVPGLPKPTAPFTISLASDKVTVSATTNEPKSQLLLGYVNDAGGTNQQISPVAASPSVPLTVSKAIGTGIVLTLRDSGDTDRQIQTSVRVVIDAANSKKIAKMVQDTTTTKTQTSNESLSWGDIAKTGLETVIKFLVPVAAAVAK
jgi:hypothetical protein